ncbi:hypothetical protein GJ744_010268 [Endocarpon pusillum]|uniref:Transmembrane protein n=1 Tax=Endocarpon pusillum TaxID=364733 RepID=A0A8H7E493_9EURO|nr:hypothetical protein GJ744_010268 [Endocarpon pusillum]
MFERSEGSHLFRLVVVGLYSLLLTSLAETVIVLDLFATQSVDTTISASLILSFVGSQLSLLFLLVHSLLARRQRLAIVYNHFRSSLGFICRFLPRLLIMLWMIAAAVGIIVAARQPKCLPGHVMQPFWQIGLSCQLHRANVGIAVVAFVSTCIVFCCIEVSNRPYQASLMGITQADSDDICGLKSSHSDVSWSSTSSADSLTREKQYNYGPSDLELRASDRAQWIQKQNSVSSRPAVYPPILRYSSTGPLSLPGYFYLDRRTAASLSQIPYPHSHRSGSVSSTATSLPFALGDSYSLSPFSRAGSTVSTISRSTSGTSVRKSPLSTMRRASEPEVPVIPAKFIHTNKKPRLQRSPTLPCSWSPSLTHAPLSADPAIRAFSSESESPSHKSVTRGQGAPSMASTNGIRFVKSSLGLNLSLRASCIPPELPVRARGHSIPSISTCADSACANNPITPTVSYSTRPRISTTPSSSTSSLYIPRLRPLLASNPVDGNTAQVSQLSHYPSSTYTSRTTSSTPSTNRATCNMLEAQRVKRRWELARSREASAYGMGGWSTLPPDDRKQLTSLRRARERGREKKRAYTAS